ncbi:amidohydrolase [Aliikangiella coralliicola]|uniref:Amidohydrolase n=1 Tax=Aliikangiella coralliicola TaxID=2592383 RepID=A0A545U4Q1_9GAMM|nr:amidohydrolase [Aliikangiella coralliicola]TQV84383.1 amidohydrolase [Aliikangiella coralliicola]
MKESTPSNKLINELIGFRKDLHQNPELAFDVNRTSTIIADRLEAAGLTVTRNIGKTGLVATLSQGSKSTKSNNRAVGFRADMDALPITEANQFSHRSTAQGKFHGCGHDGHSTMLLGAALQLIDDSDFEGTIHFIFQPDEENGTGADAMINDGLFEKFPMDAVYGLHNLPGLPVGHFAIQSGPFCSFEDNFEITIQGRGGHSSMPDKVIDPIVIGASIVMNLQSIVSRFVPASDHAVVSITDFQTDGARNILASNVTISGDCRGFDKATSVLIKTKMEQIISHTCAAFGAKFCFNYSTSFEPLVNHAEQSEICVKAAGNLPDATIDGNYGRVSFSEDFAKMLKQKPGAYILMGNGDTGEHYSKPLHNPFYDFNDTALAYGINYWCSLAMLAMTE